MEVCDAYLFLQCLLVGKATRRISCMEGARSETICINGGSKRQKQKSFNKTHSVLVSISLSTHSATNHTKQKNPVKLLSSGCRRWDKREEDTQLPPHTGGMIMIKLLSNYLKYQINIHKSVLHYGKFLPRTANSEYRLLGFCVSLISMCGNSLEEYF